MVNLLAKTPLGGTEPAVFDFGGIMLKEVTHSSLTSVAARLDGQDKTHSILSKFLGNSLPKSGQSISNGTFAAFWTGPDQWMIEAPMKSHENLATTLANMSEGAFSVTEQNDAWCRFDLDGNGLERVFELMCPIPIRTFKGGEAVRTSIHHIGCFVIHRSENYFSIIGPRSSAKSLVHAIETAIHSAQSCPETS